MFALRVPVANVLAVLEVAEGALENSGRLFVLLVFVRVFVCVMCCVCLWVSLVVAARAVHLCVRVLVRMMVQVKLCSKSRLKFAREREIARGSRQISRFRVCDLLVSVRVVVLVFVVVVVDAVPE